MAVPQIVLPSCRNVGRKDNMLRIRRKNAVDGRWYCGTVITVPYKMVARRGDSRIARRPAGAGKIIDARNGAATGWIAPGFISSGYLAQKRC